MVALLADLQDVSDAYFIRCSLVSGRWGAIFVIAACLTGCLPAGQVYKQVEKQIMGQDRGFNGGGKEFSLQFCYHGFYLLKGDRRHMLSMIAKAAVQLWIIAIDE